MFSTLSSIISICILFFCHLQSEKTTKPCFFGVEGDLLAAEAAFSPVEPSLEPSCTELCGDGAVPRGVSAREAFSSSLLV